MLLKQQLQLSAVTIISGYSEQQLQLSAGTVNSGCSQQQLQLAASNGYSYQQLQ